MARHGCLYRNYTEILEVAVTASWHVEQVKGKLKWWSDIVIVICSLTGKVFHDDSEFAPKHEFHVWITHWSHHHKLNLRGTAGWRDCSHSWCLHLLFSCFILGLAFAMGCLNMWKWFLLIGSRIDTVLTTITSFRYFVVPTAPMLRNALITSLSTQSWVSRATSSCDSSAKRLPIDIIMEQSLLTCVLKDFWVENPCQWFLKSAE